MKIQSILAFTFALGAYLAGFVYFALFYYSGWIVRSILIGIYIYQIAFAKKSELIWNIFKTLNPTNYFNSYEVLFEEKLAQDNTLILMHPHGVLASSGIFSKVVSKELEPFHTCASRFMLRIPLGGLMAILLGAVAVNKPNLLRRMKNHDNLIIIPGGFDEANITSHSEDRIFIQNRKGFMKFALEHGYRIHPSYTFGENKMYYTWIPSIKLGLFLAKYKIPFLPSFGKPWIYPFNNIDITVVIGSAIQLPKILNPTTEEINKYHKIYMERLENLYYKHRKQFGGSEKLKIY